MNVIILLITEISSYKLIYKLKLLTFFNLVMKFLQVIIYSVRLNAYKIITYIIIKMKKMYNRNYKLFFFFFKLKKKIIFIFLKKYIIAFIKILEFKFCY